ncbi:MAG: NTF2-like N-terminal transpeptidase domain-containing protein [Nocardioidaceae bacterium]
MSDPSDVSRSVTALQLTVRASARQRQSRTALAAGALLLLVAACTGGGADPEATGTQSTPAVSGGDVIEAFAAAWPKGDTSAFRGLVDQPSVAAKDIAAHVAELDIADTAIELTGELDCGDESCQQFVTVTHQLAGAGEWSYDTLVRSSLNQGQWLVQWSPGTFHSDLSEVTTLERTRTLPPRAPLLDRTGIALTPERRIVRIGVVPKDVRPRTYDEIGDLLGIDTASLRERVDTAQANWFVPVIDLRRLDYRPLRERLLSVPGISVDTARRALAPTAEWGRAVLGTVGPATVETLQTAGPYAVATDEIGTTGLQLAYQEQLAGTPGIVIHLVEKATGQVLNEVLSRDPEPGQPLQTSLSFDAQSAAEEAVDRCRRDDRGRRGQGQHG